MTKLKEARLRDNLSETALAEKVGISRGTYRKWEQGEADDIKISTLNKLSDELGLTPIAILKEMKEFRTC